MKRIIKSAVVAASVFSLSVSCTDKIKIETQDETFVKLTISVDDEQTWNEASSATVTVTMPEAAPVQIFAGDGAGMKLAASYPSFSGTKSFTFDVARDVKSVIVVNTDTDEIKTVDLGGTVTFSKPSVGVSTVYTGSNSGFTVSRNDSYQTYMDISSLAEKTFWYGAAFDFGITSSIVLNPVHFQTISTNTFGVFYYDGGQMVKVPFYLNNADGDYMSENFIQFSDVWHPNDWQTPVKTGLYYGENRRSKSIIIQNNIGATYGFYVEAYPGWGDYATNTKTYYSVAALNDDGVSHVLYREEGGYAFICFEDDMDFDYNDMVFVAGSAGKAAPCQRTEEPYSWILACEDLGMSSDYDFNDVVLQISHVCGSDKATVQPLAAGGTLRSYIQFNGQQIGKEIHEMFGTDIYDNKGALDRINTTTYNMTAESIEVTVGADFTMSSTDMGGFTIKTQSVAGTSVIASPDSGRVPNMICVPASWKWPREAHSIITAYPYFSQWGANHEEMTDWYMTCTSDLVVSR